MIPPAFALLLAWASPLLAELAKDVMATPPDVVARMRKLLGDN
jgi:hypothetical protein